MSSNLLKSLTKSIISARYTCICPQIQNRIHISNTKWKDHRNKMSDPAVVVVNEDLIVAWHPEQQFPYEHTKPIPRNQQHMSQGDSALKVQHILDEQNKYHSAGPSDEQLQQIFFTTKHKWFPQNQKARRKVDPPKEREGI
ncbi:unnamed protein product [Owenia fusiformis]|uniref:Large ribosomal subunit protein mL42 n=1 Tax=Owenia fusiformis TaxID=6347 RepID=A0A8J1T6J6_OWEFU|nr:unnamed protein product [Owenia fusiformis]